MTDIHRDSSTDDYEWFQFFGKWFLASIVAFIVCALAWTAAHSVGNPTIERLSLDATPFIVTLGITSGLLMRHHRKRWRGGFAD